MPLDDDVYPKHGTQMLCYWDSRRVRWLPVRPLRPALTEQEEKQIEALGENDEQDSPDS